MAYGLNQIVITVFNPVSGDPPRWKIIGMNTKANTDSVTFDHADEFPLAVAKICEYMARLEPPNG